MEETELLPTAEFPTPLRHNRPSHAAGTQPGQSKPCSHARCPFTDTILHVKMKYDNYNIPYSLAFSTLASPDADDPRPLSPLISSQPSTHASTALPKPSISSKVFPAWRHILTLSLPSGTVGATIGRTMKPLCWQCCAKLRGCNVKSGIMGDFGFSALRRRSLGEGRWRRSIEAMRL